MLKHGKTHLKTVQNAIKTQLNAPAMTNIIYDIAYTDYLLFMIYEKYVPTVEYQYPKNKVSLCKEQSFTLGEQSLLGLSLHIRGG